MIDHVIINIRDLASLLLAQTPSDKEWITTNANYIISMCKRVSSNQRTDTSVSNTPFTVRFIFNASSPENDVEKFVKCWGDLLETIKNKHQGFLLSWEREVKTSGFLFWKSETIEYVLSVKWDGAV